MAQSDAHTEETLARTVRFSSGLPLEPALKSNEGLRKREEPRDLPTVVVGDDFVELVDSLTVAS